MKFSLKKVWKWFHTTNDGKDLKELIIPEQVAVDPNLAARVIVYKDAAVARFVQQVPLYAGKEAHDVGDLVRLRNNALALITDFGGIKYPLFISAYKQNIAEVLQKLNVVREHQLLVNAKWPAQSDPDFRSKLQALFEELGFKPEGSDKIDPQACYKSTENVTLKYYQKIVSTFAVYGPYRGVLVYHGLGSGKTCTSIAAIDNFLAFNKVEEVTKNKADPVTTPPKIAKALTTPSRATSAPISLEKDRHLISTGSLSPAAAVTRKVVTPLQTGGAAKNIPKVFFVIPPKANLEQNFRSELSKCPSRLKEMIAHQKERGLKIDASQAANRIINQNINIISYVSLSNRLRKGVMSLEDSLLILDEAHNFLDPLTQYKAAYNHLYEQIKKTKNCKLLLLTGTPIFKSVADLPRLLNLLKRDTEVKFPETEDAFFAKYFNNGKIDKNKFVNDIKGYISFYDAESDLSRFAKKVELPPIITHVTEQHYSKWRESRKSENHSYGFDVNDMSIKDLVLAKNPKFKSGVSGYYKRSSAINNLPLAYRSKDKWPEKFTAIAKQLELYPKDKHFIYSRHQAQGANAMGEFLQSMMGWDRMSNNKYDHGTKGPTEYNPLARELTALKNKKLEKAAYIAEKAAVIQRHLKSPYKGFVVANKGTSQRELTYDKEIFNDTEDNVDGKLCRVFIVDDALAEGLSLMNTTHVHLMEPVFSEQAYRQIIGRARRLCSHRQLAWPWQLRVHQYVTNLDEEHPMTDGLLKEYSSEAQAVLQQIIDTVKDASLENGFVKSLPQTVTMPASVKKSLWNRLLELLFKKKKVATT